jgi:hypothetical protein
LFERIEFQPLLGFERLRGQPLIHDFPYNIGNAAFLPPGDLRQRFMLLLFQQDLCAVHVRFAHQSPPRPVYTSACVTVNYIYEEQNCDSAQDPGREDEWAGEFGPYMIPSQAHTHDGVTTVYFVLSTWNPYAVMLMKTDLRLEPAP